MLFLDMLDAGPANLPVFNNVELKLSWNNLTYGRSAAMMLICMLIFVHI